eukprot:maker-scaffold_14-snap-gene-9.33-mRNA-1 protein AED:0.00 eAED:0.00 QI:125/1/1/1/1/1/2/94/629
MAEVDQLNNLEAVANEAPKKKDSFLLEFLDMKGISLGQTSTPSVTSGRSFASRTIKIPRIQAHDLQILPPDYKVYDKYKNMLKVGLEEGQIRHKMIQDGLDPDGLFNNPLPTNASVKRGKKKKGDNMGKVRRASKVLEKFAPNSTVYDRYVKMLDFGMQEGPVLQKIVYDGLDPEGFLSSEAYNSFLNKEQEQIMAQKLEILKMTLPKIRARPQKGDFTGVHAILGEFFQQRLDGASDTGSKAEAKPVFQIPKKELVSLAPDASEYEQYGKMFSIGLGEPQVFHKLIKDGLSPQAFMESDVYNSYLADQQKALMDQKLDILKRFLPKMQLLKDKERAKTVTKADFAEVQNFLSNFLSDEVLKRQKEESKPEENRFTPPPVELMMLGPDNPLFEKYAKMMAIGLREGAVLHKVVYDGLDPEGFIRSDAYKKVLDRNQEKLKRQKMKILDIFLPKAQTEPEKGNFEDAHQILGQLFEQKKKSSMKNKISKKNTFRTMRPKKLRKLHEEDPVFDNYVKMLRIGLAETQVIHKLVHDGIEPESFLDSAVYKEHLLKQQEEAKQRKLALLREFLPKLQTEEDEESEAGKELTEAERAIKEIEDMEKKEEKEKTLKDEMANLNNKIGNFFNSFWR